jgi:hypothetical protein
MESPAILRRSRTSHHREGIGNAYGGLGKYMCGHTVATLLLVMGLGAVPPIHSKTFAINTYYGPTAEWPYPQGVIQMAGQLPAFDQSAVVRAVLSRSLVCFCMTEEPSSKDKGLTFVGDELSPKIERATICKGSLARLTKGATAMFREAGIKAVVKAPTTNMGWHGVGTARMGNDPRTSVIDAQCRVHGFDNLYVVDSCSLPSPGAVNTGLTLMAMALRAEEGIARQVTDAPVREAV